MFQIEKLVKYALFLVLVWGLLWVQRNFACAKVEHGQMEPAFKKGSTATYDPRGASPDEFRQGDVVCYERQAPGRDKTEFLGRIVAVAGQRVGIVKGQVMVDGALLPEDYVNPDNRKEEDFAEILVPRDCFFVLNDNRVAAVPDSRTLGPISFYSIWGKVKE